MNIHWDNVFYLFHCIYSCWCLLSVSLWVGVQSTQTSPHSPPLFRRLPTSTQHCRLTWPVRWTRDAWDCTVLTLPCCLHIGGHCVTSYLVTIAIYQLLTSRYGWIFFIVKIVWLYSTVYIHDCTYVYTGWKLHNATVDPYSHAMAKIITCNIADPILVHWHIQLAHFVFWKFWGPTKYSLIDETWLEPVMSKNTGKIFNICVSLRFERGVVSVQGEVISWSWPALFSQQLGSSPLLTLHGEDIRSKTWWGESITAPVLHDHKGWDLEWSKLPVICSPPPH